MSDFSPPQLERQLGMHAYLTASEGTGGTIKNEIEDFIVSEIPLLPAANERGNFVICRVTARNWETNRLVRELSRRLQIGRKRIGFAGTKDKRGLTSRYMSFEGVDEGVLRSIDIRDVDVEVVGRANRRLNLGDLWGNSFSITIRDCSYSGNRLAEVASAVISELKQTKGFPNFYGVQRFGSIRPNTHIVGRYIVKKDFRGAVHAYAGNPSGKENDEVRQARTLFDEGADADEVFSSMPDVMVFERILLSHLSEHPDDYAGALRRLPSNLLMMFVHALQASLFNEMISARIAEDLPLHLAVEGDIVLPINEHHLPDRGRLVSVSATNISAV
ncbi:MAG: tRNA pseudouridine(13) synthase TruD, partial [Thermoplasmata archaeon]|nr:tRNA pseudouridine(13) synthase TruD [Candidatus Sysuiplasma superficiale]